jgi:hypothetical protein
MICILSVKRPWNLERTKGIKETDCETAVTLTTEVCPVDGTREIGLRSQQLATPPSTPSTETHFPPSRQPEDDRIGLFATFGYISAVLSLFIVPEVFGSAAILLGAYVWRKEQGNRGLSIVILGIAFMLIGLVFTAYFALVDLIPS